MIYFAVFTFFVVSYVFIDFYWKFYKMCDIPGPFCVPLISHARKCLFKDLSAILDILRELKDNYGDFLKTWFGPKLYFCVNKPEYLKVILNHQNCLEKGSDYKLFTNVLRNGLLTAPVDTWRVHRKIINPTFSQSLFTSRLSVVNKSAENLIEILKHKSEYSEIFCDVSNSLLDGTSEIMFRLKIDALKNNENIIREFEEIEKISMFRAMKIWLQPEFLFKFSRYHEKCAKSVKNVEDFALKVFNKKISETREDDRYFFAHLLKYYRNNELSKEDFLDQIKLLVAAGAETTASSICFCLTLIAMHREIQEKMYDEIIENIGNREITVEDLPKLKYTECIIKESFRLAPVVLVILRKATDDISLDKYIIPRGSEILISIMDLHRDAKYWPDPLKFDPDRFLPENASKIYPYSYLPFSAGPRNCIGQKQGLISMKIVLAHLVRYFKIGTSYKSLDEIELLPQLITKPKNGFKINLEKRF